jgi:cell division control protein 45
MINCGGLIDAREFFEIEDFTKIYIVDSHRPLNLSNVDPRNLQVCVFDDDDDTERFDRVLDAYEAVTVKR